ncbi:hypothetical protein Salat_1435700 [Sesamum alatum]|uniref:Uncharacterized protein n=1 Tax=Sesamum alatum TaxID=300844 RepID=A0AAE1YAH2_9LAMI|nr:hypothetical protein Salat_1435700 [Sesamum alatum]
MARLKGTCFDNLLNVTDPTDHFSKLLSALVPFYQVEHHCFRFGVNETLKDDDPEVDGRAIVIPITLRDVLRITNLPIDGEPVIEYLEGVDFAVLCNELLGIDSCVVRENQAKGQARACISLSLLQKEFGNKTEDEISEPEDFAHYFPMLEIVHRALEKVVILEYIPQAASLVLHNSNDIGADFVEKDKADQPIEFPIFQGWHKNLLKPSRSRYPAKNN